MVGNQKQGGLGRQYLHLRGRLRKKSADWGLYLCIPSLKRTSSMEVSRYTSLPLLFLSSCVSINLFPGSMSYWYGKCHHWSCPECIVANVRGRSGQLSSGHSGFYSPVGGQCASLQPVGRPPESYIYITSKHSRTSPPQNSRRDKTRRDETRRDGTPD